MKCPFCNISDTRVLDSRLLVDGKQIKRRRECLACSARFNTYEIAELHYPVVVKANKTRQTFSEEKLRKGISLSLQKRPFSEEEREYLIQGILDRIRRLGEKEITSSTIGNLVMIALKDFDQVAYVRFASVYRSFDDLESFRKEIQDLGSEK